MKFNRCPICLENLSHAQYFSFCFKLDHALEVYDNRVDLYVDNKYCCLSNKVSGTKIFLIEGRSTKYLGALNFQIEDYFKEKTVEQIISKIETLLVFR